MPNWLDKFKANKDKAKIALEASKIVSSVVFKGKGAKVFEKIEQGQEIADVAVNLIDLISKLKKKK